MRKIPYSLPFFLALFTAIFGAIFFPLLPLQPFTPLLAITYYTSSLETALFFAALCGCLTDLVSSEFQFGLYTANFILTTCLLYPFKNHFFEDNPLSFSLFTGSISACITVIQTIIAYLFDRGIHVSFSSFFGDLIFISTLDALYAFFWFTSPIKLYSRLKGIIPKGAEKLGLDLGKDSRLDNRN